MSKVCTTVARPFASVCGRPISTPRTLKTSSAFAIGVNEGEKSVALYVAGIPEEAKTLSTLRMDGVKLIGMATDCSLVVLQEAVTVTVSVTSPDKLAVNVTEGE